MESMNGQAIVNGQGHLKNYNQEDRMMKNGSTGSNSSEYSTFTIILLKKSKLMLF